VISWIRHWIMVKFYSPERRKKNWSKHLDNLNDIINEKRSS